MAVRETAKAVMAVLALVGIAGMFVRNHRRFGIVGLVGYVLLSIGYFAMFAVESIVGFVLPAVARTSPAYVQGFIDEAMGRTSDGGIGRMHYVLLAMAVGYAIGGLLFGIALFRARILSRWASLLLAYGTISVLALAVAAGVLQPPLRRPDRRRPDRPGRLAVARPAHRLRTCRPAGLPRAARRPMTTQPTTRRDRYAGPRVEGHAGTGPATGRSRPPSSRCP